jgi:hypothetical protein
VHLTCEKFFIHFNIDEEAWAMLIGSLADGPLWVLGPNGPVPVDPWGPLVAREAEAARKQIFDGVRQLQKLGSQLERSRQEVTAKVAPAVDKEALEADSGAFVS